MKETTFFRSNDGSFTLLSKLPLNNRELIPLTESEIQKKIFKLFMSK